MLDDDWVSSVKRWCQDQQAEKAAAVPSIDDVDVNGMLGYETARPRLQAQVWNDGV